MTTKLAKGQKTSKKKVRWLDTLLIHSLNYKKGKGELHFSSTPLLTSSLPNLATALFVRSELNWTELDWTGLNAWCFLHPTFVEFVACTPSSFIPSFLPSSLSSPFLGSRWLLHSLTHSLSLRPSFLSDSRFVVSETAKKRNWLNFINFFFFLLIINVNAVTRLIVLYIYYFSFLFSSGSSAPSIGVMKFWKKKLITIWR